MLVCFFLVLIFYKLKLHFFVFQPELIGNIGEYKKGRAVYPRIPAAIDINTPAL